jgi:hypothetical protein
MINPAYRDTKSTILGSITTWRRNLYPSRRRARRCRHNTHSALLDWRRRARARRLFPSPCPLYGPIPFCKVFPAMTGTGLLPYIRPVDEASVVASGPDDFRAHRPHLSRGLTISPGLGQVFDAPYSLLCHQLEEDLRNRFAGKLQMGLGSLRLSPPTLHDNARHGTGSPRQCAPACWPVPPPPRSSRSRSECG